MNEQTFFVQMVGREVWVKFSFVQMVETNPGKCEWVWEEKLRWQNPRWPISRWQNSRWLPSSSWVRMNKFESDWISLIQSQSGVRVFLSESERRKQCVWIQHGRIQDDCHHQVESKWMSLSQIELVWLRVLCKMAESKLAEFKMAAIIKLIWLN